jgi:hypothetical protein
MLSLADSHDRVPAKKIMLMTLMKLVIFNALIFLIRVAGKATLTHRHIIIHLFLSSHERTSPLVSPSLHEHVSTFGNKPVPKSPISTT